MEEVGYLNKIKKMWHENRVLLVLFIIIFVCLCVVLGVLFNYFFGVTKSNYGDRLKGIEEVVITDEIKNNYLESMKNDEFVEDVTIKTRGKIIYINMLFNESASLAIAKSKAGVSLQFFEEKYLNFYDFHFTLKEESTETSEGFLIMGARNVNGNELVWNNNTEVPTEE